MTDKLPPALDVACGARSFYFDKDDERVLKCDAHPRHLTLCDGRTLDVSPDIVADFRELPYPDKSFSECLRVLKPCGVLVFKWYEYHIPLKELALAT